MRPEGLQAAARALRFWQGRQEVVSHNLANVSTDGFRAERTFAELLDGGPELRSYRDPAPGSLAETGRSLDLALTGEGFLVSEGGAGARLLRGGSLEVDAEGVLRAPTGEAVMGAGGRIVLPPGEPAIAEDGTVRVAGEVIDRLRVVLPAEGTVLSREEGGRLSFEGGLRDAPQVRVRSGHLESSNQSATEAMVEMIETQRAYQSVQRSVQVMDRVLDSVANDVGRIG